MSTRPNTSTAREHRLDAVLAADVNLEGTHRGVHRGGCLLLPAADVGREHLRTLVDEESASQTCPISAPAPVITAIFPSSKPPG
jgi:hypothetical protein